MSKALHGLWVMGMALALWIPGAGAQETAQAVNSPNTPYSTLPLFLGRNRWAADSGTGRQELSEVTRYTSALSGAEEFRPGATHASRSFLLPTLSFYQGLDSNPLATVHPEGIATLSSILGSLALQRNFGHTKLTLNYVGGWTVTNSQLLSNGRAGRNAIIQQLGATETVAWRRFKLLVTDQFTYFPEPSFGAIQGGVNSFGSGIGDSLGEGLPALRSFLTPDQSILTDRGRRVSNTFVTQGEYYFNARSSITSAGAYGFLRFFDSTLLDSYNTMFMTGYNRRISRANTLAVIFRFSSIRFTNLDRAIDDHIAQLSFGRRITGRLAFCVAAGPEVDLVRSTGDLPQNRLFWNVESALHYRLSRTAFDLSYERGLTSGAGILAGAVTNRVEATWNKRLSRTWQGSFGAGYANNRNLPSGTVPRMDRTFNTGYGRVQFSRLIGRSADAFAGYLVQLQGSNAPICTGPLCTTSHARHEVFLGLTWHHHPIALR